MPVKPKKKTAKKTTKKPVKKVTKKPPTDVQETPDPRTKDSTMKTIEWFEQAVIESRGSALLCVTCMETISSKEEEQKHLDHLKYHWSAGHAPLESRGIRDFITMIRLNRAHQLGLATLWTTCKFCQSKIEPDTTKCVRCNKWQVVPDD